jgi:hypothetical protein
VGNPIEDGEPATSADATESAIDAVGGAHIARTRTPGCADLMIVVTDDRGNTVHTMPLSQVSSPSTGLRLGDILRDTQPVVVSSIVALAIVVLTATTAFIIPDKKTYQIASAPNGGAGLAVRFIAQTKPDDIADFLAKYKGVVVAEPRLGGFYRIRISRTTVQQDLAKVATLMAQEEIVELVAVEPQL